MKKITIEISQDTYDLLKDQIEEKENKLKEETKKKFKIKNNIGEVIYESEKTTYKEVIEEAINIGADLREADLMNCKFYGKSSSPKILTKKQVPDFLLALGFKVE